MPNPWSEAVLARLSLGDKLQRLSWIAPEDVRAVERLVTDRLKYRVETTPKRFVLAKLRARQRRA